MISPTMLMVYLLIYYYIFGRSKKLIALIIVVLLISNNYIANLGYIYLESDQKYFIPSGEIKYDAIVVLTGTQSLSRIGSEIKVEWSDPDRLFKSVELYKLKTSSYILFTGGGLPWDGRSNNEGDEYKRIAIELGVPSDKILITQYSQNVEEESKAVAKTLDDKIGLMPKKILLVTSAYQMQRAADIFGARKLQVTKVPVDFRSSAAQTTLMSLIPSAGALANIEFTIRELIGRFYYKLKLLYEEFLSRNLKKVI